MKTCWMITFNVLPAGYSEVRSGLEVGDEGATEVWLRNAFPGMVIVRGQVRHASVEHGDTGGSLLVIRNGAEILAYALEKRLPPPTGEQFLREMMNYANYGDSEAAHGRATDLLVETFSELLPEYAAGLKVYAEEIRSGW